MKKKDYREYCQLINQIKLSDTSQEELPKLQPLVDWICKNTPKRLFRYRRYDKKNVNAFKKQRIWLSTAKNMNDDFDSALYCDIKKINSELDELFDSNGVLKLDKLLERDDVYSVLLQSYSKEEIENAKCSFANAEREELRNFSLALKPYIEKKPCALYLGRKIKTENECELRNIALRQNIPIYKMRIDPTDKKHRLQALLPKGPWQDN